MLRAQSVLPPGSSQDLPYDIVMLEHDARRLRRKVLKLVHGEEVLVDFPQTLTLEDRCLLKLDDGRLIEVLAADEELYEVRCRTPEDLLRLAWHIGNRHTPAQLEAARILIKRDHVLKTMLEGLGANVANVVEPFFAEHGAYHSHPHGDGANALKVR